MNWYYLYKLSSIWRNDNDVLSSKITDKIFSVVKDTMGNKMSFSFPIDKKCFIFVSINYIDGELQYKSFQIIADTNISKSNLYNPYIRIQLEFNKDFIKNDFYYFYYVLLDAIRNEIEHYDRYIKNKLVEDSKLQFSTDNYLESCYLLKDELLSDNEIEPYIRGLFLVARKLHIPFSKKLEESLDGLFFRSNAQIKESIINSKIGAEINFIFSEIKNKIIQHTSKMFPEYKL